MNGNLSAIREEGLRVLVKSLGAAGTVNFLRQFENGSGNYTDERENILAENSIDDIAKRIKERKARYEERDPKHDKQHG
jgi:hypothetical protein